MSTLLARHFYQRDTVEVAQDLLGIFIVRQINGQLLVAKIVETEAYCGVIDPASHAYRGPTVRNQAMFGPVGHAYIYISYGIHFCLNVVARIPAQPAGGVLIRAVQPIEGIEFMKLVRRTQNLHDLTNGPGKVTQALAINLALKGADLTKKGDLHLVQAENQPAITIKATPRIGISLAKEQLWRFFIKDNPWVTKSKFNK
jgi:DNA-3-methyladenine glycosylase